MKKVAVFMLVCLFLVGIAVVDDSHSLMTGKEAELSLQTRRIDSNTVRFSMLGVKKDVNITEASRVVRKVRKDIVSQIDGIAGCIRKCLGFTEWPRKDFTFDSRVL
jgi:hypothetical protein